MAGQPPPYDPYNTANVHPPPGPGYPGGYPPAPAGYGAPPAGYAPAPAGYGAPPAGYAPPPAGYAPAPAGYAPAPAGYAPGPAGYAPPPGGVAAPPAGFAGGCYPGAAPQPQSDRPPKEHCFYLMNNQTRQIMEVAHSSVDPGTRVVMATHTGHGQDNQLWFEDYATGTIKSRLSLLCLDVQDTGQPYHTIKSPSSVPPNAVCLGKQGGRPHYNAVAHTQWGSIPGKAVANQCWYSYGGAEYCSADFSWVVAPSVRLVRSTGGPPGGAVGVGHQTDDGSTYYLAVARSQWGTIPGKAKGNTCWFPQGSKEHYTQDFDWVVAESNMVVVNPYMPGKQTQLWLRAGDRIQNRQDSSKVLQQCGATLGSQIISTTTANDPSQTWSFPPHGTAAPPAGCVPPPAGAALPAKPPGGHPHTRRPRPPPQRTSPEPSLGKLLGDFTALLVNAKLQKKRRYFFIRSELHGKVMDVSGQSKQPGTKVIMWPRKNPAAANQLWYTDAEGIIRSKLTDFCLQPSGHGIWLQPYSNKPNQQWIQQGNRIVMKQKPDICLDIRGSERKDGAQLCQFKYKGSPNQHWAWDYV